MFKEAIQNFYEGSIERIEDARTYKGRTASKPKWNVLTLDLAVKKSGNGLFNHVKLVCYDIEVLLKLVVGVGYRFEVSIEGEQYIPKGGTKNQKDIYNEIVIINAERV